MRRVEHRALSWRIATDAALWALPCDSARLAYTWLIAFQDNCGRLPGEPVDVRAMVGKRAPWTDAQIEEWLGAMHSVGLVVWYRVRGLRYLYLCGNGGHQKLVGNMRAVSDYPEPPQTEVATAYERRTNIVPTEGEGKADRSLERSRVKGTTTNPQVVQSADLSGEPLRVHGLREHLARKRAGEA